MAFARGRPAARPAVAEATAEAAVMAADIGLETPVCLKAPGARINDDALERRRYFTRERNEMAEIHRQPVTGEFQENTTTGFSVSFSQRTKSASGGFTSRDYRRYDPGDTRLPQ